jgi:CelD/BcsL family acetyltransferase involved in cellulose biosynthesis
MPPLRSLTCELITTTESLISHTSEWQELWAQDTRATPFQSPQWLVPWWKHLGVGELFTIAVRDDNCLIALLPMYIHRPPSANQRQLLFLGVGTSDYLDALVLPGREQDVLSLLVDFLMIRPRPWDVAYLQQLRGDSPLLRLAQLSIGHTTERDADPCYFLVPGAHTKPKMRSNLSYYRRRAEKSGKLRVQMADQATAPTLFDELVHFHSSRWHTRGETGVLADERVQRAHRESVPLLYQRGLLRLSALTLNDRPVAVIYALTDAPTRPHRRFYCYLTGFDPDWNSISPGTLLLGSMLEQAAREKASAVDFLRGHERYKEFWGVQTLTTRALELRP